jgi:two-component sensor histidine kinase
MEARNAQQVGESERFNRLAGRIEALSILYRSIYAGGKTETVDLGTCVSQIASSVMAAHAIEGIRLDMKVDTWPVSVNVAVPVGLIVNELMTKALKYAFVGRDGGEIKVRCTIDGEGCKVLIADDGIGLTDKGERPRRGKLTAMIVQSVRNNAKGRDRRPIQARRGNGSHGCLQAGEYHRSLTTMCRDDRRSPTAHVQPRFVASAADDLPIFRRDVRKKKWEL